MCRARAFLSAFRPAGRPCAALAVLCLSATLAQADGYTLGTGDRLHVTLLENEQVDGTYLIATDGTVSVPGIGVVQAEGLDLRSFEARLREAAAVRIVDPSISVQIAEYRPFYVLGDVDRSGLYPFTPGLNVMKAIAIAGGFGRKVDSDTLSRAIAVNQARKSLAESSVELFSARVNLARLLAERAMADQFTYDGAAGDGISAEDRQRVIENARNLFATRQQAFVARLARLEETRAARIAEVASFDSQLALQDEVHKTIQAELERLEEAKERGLVSDTRANAAIREEQNARAQTLQIATLKRQAEVNLAALEREIDDLTAGRAVDIDQGVQLFEDTIQKTGARIRQDRAMLRETGARGPNTSGAPVYRLELYRNGEGPPEEPDFDTPLNPGDTLLVTLSDDDAPESN